MTRVICQEKMQKKFKKMQIFAKIPVARGVFITVTRQNLNKSLKMWYDLSHIGLTMVKNTKNDS